MGKNTKHFAEAVAEMRHFLLGAALVLVLVTVVPALAQDAGVPPSPPPGGSFAPPPGGQMPPPPPMGDQQMPPPAGQMPPPPTGGSFMPPPGGMPGQMPGQTGFQDGRGIIDPLFNPQMQGQFGDRMPPPGGMQNGMQGGMQNGMQGGMQRGIIDPLFRPGQERDIGTEFGGEMNFPGASQFGRGTPSNTASGRKMMQPPMGRPSFDNFGMGEDTMPSTTGRGMKMPPMGEGTDMGRRMMKPPMGRPSFDDVQMPPEESGAFGRGSKNNSSATRTIRPMQENRMSSPALPELDLSGLELNDDTASYVKELETGYFNKVSAYLNKTKATTKKAVSTLSSYVLSIYDIETVKGVCIALAGDGESDESITDLDSCVTSYQQFVKSVKSAKKKAQISTALDTFLQDLKEVAGVIEDDEANFDIVDPAFMPNSTGKRGIVDPAFMPNSTGKRGILDPSYMPNSTGKRSIVDPAF